MLLITKQPYSWYWFGVILFLNLFINLFLIDDRIFFSIVWLRNSSCNQLEGEHDASSNHNSVIETNEHNNQSISIENNSTVVGCTSSISGPSTTTEVISTTPTAVNQQLPSASKQKKSEQQQRNDKRQSMKGKQRQKKRMLTRKLGSLLRF
mmetsp:Transcript_12894/g.17587  ORF Transcript_12894/g.17587 Transcript_12894/m.17587 type:complete len:151 (-) Transcript_12894:1413-1865(-)